MGFLDSLVKAHTEDPMQLLVAITLPFLTAIILSAVCAALWWQSLQSPWQFLVLALLSLLGLHRVVQVAAESFKLLRTELGGYFLEARKPPNLHELVLEQMTAEAFAIAGVVVIAGIPLLFWLRNALPKV